MSAHFIICSTRTSVSPFFFFFNDTATTEIYTLSLHDALPIFYHNGKLITRDDAWAMIWKAQGLTQFGTPPRLEDDRGPDRKSTRLNSSHLVISYAVFCLKKKK